MEKNIENLINEYAVKVGFFASLDWKHELEQNIEDYTVMTSPIERIFWCVIRTMCQIADIDKEVQIEPQTRLGEYRVDFKITYFPLEEKTLKEKTRTILIECDSQEFHERTKEERLYEKKRDRFLLSSGYKVFHFTGSEIVKTPADVAREVLLELLYSDVTPRVLAAWMSLSDIKLTEENAEKRLASFFGAAVNHNKG